MLREKTKQNQIYNDKFLITPSRWIKSGAIKVDFENGDLTIRADHHKECNKKDEFGFMVHERSEGTYERNFHFEDVDPKDITAAYANGELDICLMKAKDAKTSTSIKIH